MPLPNIRKLFRPDPGHTFFDIDLDSADLRIVAWESNCVQLKQWFREGKKPYVELMKEYYHDTSITKTHSSYPQFKSFTHGSNYLGKAKNVAARVGLSSYQGEKLQAWYFERCPEIGAWQERLKDQINSRGRITNIFGYHRIFFDRISEETFREGAAWLPQSTVAILINHAYLNIYNNLPDVQVLLQVHDSLAGQFPTSMPFLREAVLKESAIPLPYEDPLMIPVGIKTSEMSWGDCK